MNQNEKNIIRKRAYPRVGFIGNPSDGYFGRTISFTFSNFYAEIVLYESQYLELLPNERDRTIYDGFSDITSNIHDYGYYGGIRLLQAALKRFHEYCANNNISLEKKNFSIRYFSNIPPHVGLAGSSAIITACMRGLMEFFHVDIPNPVLSNLVLSVEKEELKISAGLQDRVAQVFQGLIYMDFEKQIMEKQGYGNYEPLDKNALPPIYVAYKTELSEGSEVFHNNIRARYDMGEELVVQAMTEWAEMTNSCKVALQKMDATAIHKLLDANFNLRRSIYNIHPDNLEMVDTARSTGASAKFTGSGGAIVGTYENKEMFKDLVEKLKPLNIKVIKPVLI